MVDLLLYLGESNPSDIRLRSVYWTPALLTTRAWYKADELQYSDNATLTSWPDSSGNAYHATVSGTPALRTIVLNNRSVVEFTTASLDYLGIPSGATSGLTEGAIFFVAKRSADPGVADSAPIVGGFGVTGSLDHYPFSGDGNIYDGFLSTTRKTVGDPGNLASWHIGSFQSKASDWRYAFNATDFFTTVTNTVATGTSPLIGTNSTHYLEGQIAEIVFCPSFLTTAERQRIEGYLAWKWGLQDSLPADHTYKSAAPLNTEPFPIVAALTGQSLTAAQGSVTISTSPALSGQGITASSGSVVATSTIGISGQSVTAAGGTLTPAFSFTLTGQALTVARGSVTPGMDLALSGQSVSVAQGSIALTFSVAVSGQSITAAQGSTAASSSIGLSGQSITVSRGSLLASSGLALTGSGIAAAQGSLAPALSTALAGQSLIAGQGSVVPGSALTCQPLPAME
jgi:hypothetical protein